MSMPDVFIGIDISKAHFDLYRSDRDQHWRIANRPEAIASLVGELPPGCRVFFEATGGLDRPLCLCLDAAGVWYNKANPRRVREFARADGRLAKTDRVDAEVLAAYGAKLQPPRSVAASPECRRLGALVRRREQLVAMRGQEKTRRHQIPRHHQIDSDDAFIGIAEDIDEMVAVLSRHIVRIEAEMRRLINRNPELSAIDQRLRYVPGIGDINAATLIADLPELGHRDRRAITMLAGLAPLSQDSGKRRGGRRIWGGRRSVRHALYIAAVSARRCPRFGAHHQNLIDQGKPRKVAMVATARKILVTINAMIRDQKDFQASTA